MKTPLKLPDPLSLETLSALVWPWNDIEAAKLIAWKSPGKLSVA